MDLNGHNKLVSFIWSIANVKEIVDKFKLRHKLLRSIEEVSAEILELEKENEGLIADILNLD